MSQSNPTIGANKSGLTYRQEDNDGKKALLNHHKGSSVPSYAEAGAIWLDDTFTPWVLKIHDGTDWINLGEVHATNNTFTAYSGALAAPGLANANSFTRGQVIDGVQDEIQLRVQAFNAQISNVLVVEQSNGADVFTVTNTGLVTAGAFNTTAPSIADDAVYSFTPPVTSGFVLVHTQNGNASNYLQAQFCASGTAVMNALSIGSVYNVTTGVLTGTTGTDTKITVSAHTDGKIYIENRSGATATIKCTVIG